MARLCFGLHNPATSNPSYRKEEEEFIMAVDAYKRKTGRQFPTLRELFRIMENLGYTRGRPSVPVVTEGHTNGPNVSREAQDS